MHRIDNPSAVQQIPTVAPVGRPGYFFNGDPRRGQVATQLDQDWFNATQEEIAHVIETAGIALDKARFDQLLLAILAHIRNNIPPFPPLPFLPLAGGTMQGPIYQHIAPTPGTAELTNSWYVDSRDNAVIAHADAQDVAYHALANNYASNRAIQEGNRAQDNAWAWDQPILDKVNWIDATQGGMAAFGADGLFTVPSAARVIEVTATGGGGGGGGAQANGRGGGGGGAGGSGIGSFGVAPGQQFWVSIGGGGAPGGAGGHNGSNGGATQFGDLVGAYGGGGGIGSGGDNAAGGAPRLRLRDRPLATWRARRRRHQRATAARARRPRRRVALGRRRAWRLGRRRRRPGLRLGRRRRLPHRVARRLGRGRPLRHPVAPMSGSPPRRLALMRDGVVWEIKLIEERPHASAEFGNPGGVWHDVTDIPEIAPGWTIDSTGGYAPPPPAPPPAAAAPVPDLFHMKQQLDALEARVAAWETKP